MQSSRRLIRLSNIIVAQKGAGKVGTAPGFNQCVPLPAKGHVTTMQSRLEVEVVVWWLSSRQESRAGWFRTTDGYLPRSKRFISRPSPSANASVGRCVRSTPIPTGPGSSSTPGPRAPASAKGRVFRSLGKGDGGALGASLSTRAIADMVAAYAVLLGINVAPHDRRRTFARLALKGSASLEQIQLSLGHASIRTTERHLGVEQDLTAAPCDRLGLQLS